MAKKKANAATKAKAVSATAKASISPISAVKALKEKYQGAVPRSPSQGADKIRKEIRHARQPIYTINRKIRDAPSRYYKAKYRKEKRQLEARLEPQINALVERREDFKALAKNYEVIRKEKASIRAQLKRLNKKIDRADEETDYIAIEKLTHQILKLEGNLDALSGILGMEIKITHTDDYEPSEEEDEAGYLEDPSNPYTIWQAIGQIDADKKSNNFDFFVINGKRISAKNVIAISLESSEFWRSLKRPQTDTPKVNRYVNLPKKTVKYRPYKS